MLGAFFTNFFCNDVTTLVSEHTKKKLCSQSENRKKRRMVKLRIVPNKDVTLDEGLVIDHLLCFNTRVFAWINPDMWHEINKHPFEWRIEMETMLRKRMTILMVECGLHFDGSIRYLASIGSASLEISFYYQPFQQSQEEIK